jgi:phage-related protein
MKKSYSDYFDGLIFDRDLLFHHVTGSFCLTRLNIFVNLWAMQWAVEYYSKMVEHFIFEELPDGLLARYIHLSKRMLEYGPNLKEPHTKAVGDGLFEMRLKSAEGIARVMYCTVVGRRIVMLHGFIKKSPQTPLNELETARTRMKEVKTGYVEA